MISRDIKDFLRMLKPGELFIAADIHKKYFSDFRLDTFHQLLARFCRQGLIVRLSKGVYHAPTMDKITDSIIINFLTQNKKIGFITGDYLLYEHSIIDVKPTVNNIVIYRDFPYAISNVKHIHIRSFFSKTPFTNEKFIRLMEVLYSIIKTSHNINYTKAYKYFKTNLENFSIESFDFLFYRSFYRKYIFVNAIFLFESLGLNTGLSSIISHYTISEIVVKIVKVGELYDRY